MVNLLFLTDTHFRDDKPKSRTDNVRKTQFTKLGEILTICREHDVSRVYHGGDFFNTKKPSHQLVVDVMEWCKHLSVPIYSIKGNHDITGYNLDSVRNSGLGVLFESGALEELNFEVHEKDRLVIKAIHTSLNFDQDYMFDQQYNDYKKIIISHNYIIPTDTMPWGFIHPKDIQTNADLVLCGHYHVPFEYQTEKTIWVNPGPLCRWKVNEKSHTPTVVLIEVGDKLSYKLIPLTKAQSGENIFDLENITQEKQREQDIKDFVESLERTAFHSVDIEQVIKKVAATQKIPKDVEEEVLQRIRNAKDVLS